MLLRYGLMAIVGLLITVGPGAGQGEVPNDPAAARDRKEQVLQHEPGRYIRSVAFFPDGKRLATRGWDGPSIWIHDLDTGKRVTRLDSRSTAERPPLAVSADAKRLLEGPSVWDLAARRELVEGSEEGCAALSRDGRCLAHGSAKGVLQLVEMATRKQRLRFDSPYRHISILDFHPDGSVLASLGYVDGTAGKAICLWDTATGKLLHRMNGFRGEVDAMVFSPDGSLLAVGGECGPVRLFETATGKLVRRLEGPDGMIQSVAFSPDGRVLATAAGYTKWEVHLLEVATGQQIRVLRTVARDNVIGCVAFSPDGRKFAMADRDVVVLAADVLDLAGPGQQPPADLGAKELERLWGELGGAADHAYRAMWALRTRPEKAVPFVQQRLRPAPSSDAARVEQLIADLGSDRFEVRRRATEELEVLGRAVAGRLRKILANNPSLELRSRAERLLATLENPTWSPEELRDLRALQVLEYVATPEARRLIEHLAKGGEGYWQTVEARRALARLARKAATEP